MNWSHKFWIEQAQHYATQSKDPSTKVGAVIVRPNGTLASAGVNGFPRKILDLRERLEDKPTKYRLTIHAEMNALHFAHEDLTGASLYATFCPCDDCAKHIVQRGVKRVFYPLDHENTRWLESQKNSIALFKEAGLVVRGVDMKTGIDYDPAG